MAHAELIGVADKKGKMMKKKIILLSALLAIASFTHIVGWNPFSASDWQDVGDTIRSGLETATDQTGSAFKYVGKEIEKNVIDKIVGGWEKKRQIGRLLDAGADQLEAAPDLLQNDAVVGLKTGLVDGINKNLMPLLMAKTADLATKRQEIAQFKKMVEDNKNLASELGKASLVKDLLDGFDAADEALAILWSGPDLTKAQAPKSAIGALRQKLVTTAQTANADYSKAINDSKNDSIIWDLLNAGQTVINNTNNGINDIKKQIEELKGKIYPLNSSSLPSRMRELAKILKV